MLTLDHAILKTEFLGRAAHYFETLASTNTTALDLAKRGEPHGSVIIADAQTHGRGRLQRGWRSPAGVNLYMSVILRPQVAPSDAPMLTLVSSIAVIEAIGLCGVNSRIKWPNDALINGKKVAGVLTEMELKSGAVDFIVVGIGVNLNMGEAEIQQMATSGISATSVKIEAGGQAVDRARFAADLINSLEAWYLALVRGGNTRIISEWMDRWDGLNRRVRADLDGNLTEGIAAGIDENGYLIVKTDGGGVRAVVAGDVNFID
ncbi:MAG: biotin--[acetyl-CoA-carboxylase] ligase [Deltaproteobacteria bacterium]